MSICLTKLFLMSKLSDDFWIFWVFTPVLQPKLRCRFAVHQGVRGCMKSIMQTVKLTGKKFPGTFNLPGFGQSKMKFGSSGWV